MRVEHRKIPERAGHHKDPEPAGQRKDPGRAGQRRDPRLAGQRKDPGLADQRKDPGRVGHHRDPGRVGQRKTPETTGTRPQSTEMGTRGVGSGTTTRILLASRPNRLRTRPRLPPANPRETCRTSLTPRKHTVSKIMRKRCICISRMRGPLERHSLTQGKSNTLHNRGVLLPLAQQQWHCGSGRSRRSKPVLAARRRYRRRHGRLHGGLRFVNGVVAAPKCGVPQ